MSEPPSDPPEATEKEPKEIDENAKGDAKADAKKADAKEDDAAAPRHVSLRTSVIVLTLGLAGAAGFFMAGRLSVVPTEPTPTNKAVEPKAALPPLNSFPEVSFAQQGEDLIIKSLFAQLGIGAATYLDIGAHDPMRGSNTYLFYALGSKGVVVEPNPLLAGKLKVVRKRDVVVERGIGVGGAKTGTYFEFIGDGQTNTFSVDQVKRLENLGVKPIRVSEVLVVGINDVLAEHFPQSGPHLLSIDTQGSDLAILKELDFSRWKPTVICADTLTIDTGMPNAEITSLLTSKGYTARGSTYANTIYVADDAFAKARDSGRTGVHTGGH